MFAGEAVVTVTRWTTIIICQNGKRALRLWTNQMYTHKHPCGRKIKSLASWQSQTSSVGAYQFRVQSNKVFSEYNKQTRVFTQSSPPEVLRKSEALRALVECQDEHATQFVVRLVGRQIQLIEATKKTTQHQRVNNRLMPITLTQRYSKVSRVSWEKWFKRWWFNG